MDKLLDNPVYNALLTGDAHLSFGMGMVKYFDEQVSSYVGFPADFDKGFNELFNLMPKNRRILYAARNPVLPLKDLDKVSYRSKEKGSIVGDISSMSF